MLTIFTAVVFNIFGIAQSAPEGSLLSFENGRIGVNFLGFHASAGLGSILTGNPEDGGLYASAGTPYGQFAHAGISEGRGIFAGARATPVVGAQTRIGGTQEGMLSASAQVSNNIGVHAGLGEFKNIGVEKEVDEADIQGNVQVIPSTVSKFKKTSFEKIVVTDHKENTALKEKRRFVDAAPVVIEKEVNVPPANLDLGVRAGGYVALESQPPPPPPPPVQPVYVEKTKFKVRRRPHVRKHVLISKTGYTDLEGAPPANVGIASGEGGVYGTNTFTVRKTVNPQVINDAFNIPIQTLKAVSQLVGGIAQGVEGSVTAKKSVSFGGEVGVGVAKE